MSNDTCEGPHTYTYPCPNCKTDLLVRILNKDEYVCMGCQERISGVTLRQHMGAQDQPKVGEDLPELARQLFSLIAECPEKNGTITLDPGLVEKLKYLRKMVGKNG